MSDILKLAQAIQNLADVLGANGAAIASAVENDAGNAAASAQTADKPKNSKGSAKNAAGSSQENKASSQSRSQTATDKGPDFKALRASASSLVTELFKSKQDRDLMVRLLALYEQENGKPATAASNVQDADLQDLIDKVEALLKTDDSDEIEAIIGGADEDPGFG